MINTLANERLEMRWLPVLDSNGRTRMEATWILAGPTRSVAAKAPVVHAA